VKDKDNEIGVYIKEGLSSLTEFSRKRNTSLTWSSIPCQRKY